MVDGDGQQDGGDGAGSVHTELDRDIGFVGATALGVGTMIAAGIFVLSGLAVSNVGAMAIVAFLIAAVVASFTAFAYAEFSAIYPESGGGYAYVANTFDTDLTYIVGWSMILGYPASAAFYLASFSDWFHGFILPVLTDSFTAGALENAIPFWLSGFVVLALLLGLNLKGTEESGQFQIVVTVLKVLLIGLFLVGGLQAFRTDIITESVRANTATLDDYRQIGLTSALVFITFFGFEAIATNAEEIEKPGRNVPRAIFFSMGFVTVVYTLVVVVVTLAVNNVAITGQVPFLEYLADVEGLAGVDAAREFVETHGEVAMGRAAGYFLGDVGFYVIIVGALFSMLSAANATVLAGSRVKLAMSRRGHLPPRFEELSDRFGTPYWSVLFTGGLIVFFITLFTVAFPDEAAVHVGPVEFHFGVSAIAHFADFMLLTGLIVVNVAIVRSRNKYPDLDRPFTVPGVPYVPAVAVVANLVLLVNVEPSSFVLGLLAEVVGVAVWFGVIAGPSEESFERETPTVLEETHPDRRDTRILVPVANPENTEQLVRTACDVAADRDGEILVMSAVSLPEQTPLSEGRSRVPERREIIERAREIPGSEGCPDVPFHGLVRICHHVDDAIRHTVEQHDCDAVVMGWRGRPSRRQDLILGSTVDSVVTNATCDVLVERIGAVVDPVGSVLVPTAGGPHAEYALEVARAIARTDGADVTVTTVVDPDAPQSERDRASTALSDAADVLSDVDFEGTVVEADDVVEAIVEQSTDHDLLVVGATREGVLDELVFGSIPEAVGERAHCTTIMAKRYLGPLSRVQRLVGWRS